MDNKPTMTDVLVSRWLRDMNERFEIQQADYMRVLDRSQGYVSERLSGKRSWSLNELDKIAPLVGQRDAISIVINASSYRPGVD